MEQIITFIISVLSTIMASMFFSTVILNLIDRLEIQYTQRYLNKFVLQSIQQYQQYQLDNESNIIMQKLLSEDTRYKILLKKLRSRWIIKYNFDYFDFDRSSRFTIVDLIKMFEDNKICVYYEYYGDYLLIEEQT